MLTLQLVRVQSVQGPVLQNYPERNYKSLACKIIKANCYYVWVNCISSKDLNLRAILIHI